MDEEDRRAEELSGLLAPVVGEVIKSPPGDGQRRLLDVDNAHVNEAVFDELRILVSQNDKLRAADPTDELSEVLKKTPHSREVLWDLLAEPVGKRTGYRRVDKKRKKAAKRRGVKFYFYILMAFPIFVILGFGAIAIFVFREPLVDRSFTDIALRVFAIITLSFLPGWMFLRFLDGRASALWREYVLNLHRLKWDRPRNLPRPPQTSEYYGRWVRDGGEVMGSLHNIYRDKFDAYFGRGVSERGIEPTGNLKPDVLFPVYLATFVFAVCWTFFLWNPHVLVVGSQGDQLTPGRPHIPVFAYAFFGAYAFIMEMLIRRFFQNDIRASAYLTAVARIILVMIIIAVLHPLLPVDQKILVTAVAFMIGFFPLVGVHFLRRVTKQFLGVMVPSMRPNYPLTDLDGLNIWYEARLLEEGIEDMQSLVTANFVDIILHTRVPVGRLVDWVNQAYLYLHINPARPRDISRNDKSSGEADDAPDDGKRQAAGSKVRIGLRHLGIRTATNLLDAFPSKDLADASRQPLQVTEGLEYLSKCHGVQPAMIRTMVRVLEQTPGLTPVRNWQRSGVPSCRQGPRGAQ